MAFFGIIFLVLVIVLCTQLVYMTVLRASFPIKQASFNTELMGFVSIIIASKNESKLLQDTIDEILKQSYPHFELIIADDHSTDETQKIVESIAKKDSRLIYHKVIKDRPGKRQALTEAINLARGEYILCTDADCKTTGAFWLQSMLSNTTPKTNLVLGISPFYLGKNWTNRFARYENLLTTLQYIAAVALGQAYMGVGRNMLYSKALFNTIGGYQGQEKLASGDDDLLVQKMLPVANIAVATDPQSYMWSKSETKVKAFLAQKRRHLSVSREYGNKQKLFLSIYSSTQLLFYTLLPFAFTGFPLYAGVLLVLRWVLQYFLLRDIFDLLDYKDLKKWIPFLDMLYFMYLIYFIPTILAAKSNDWNEAPRADR